MRDQVYAMGSWNAFFYGTLMHPKVLSRVIGHDHDQVVPAVLPGHVRLHVKGEDYPAVTTLAEAKKALGRELSKDETSVRGTVALGLSADDVAYLDEFEGDEYERVSVQVEPTEGGKPIDAQVYLWKAPTSRLSPDLWSFEDFMSARAHRWVGNDVYRQDYAEVDRRRAMKGTITPREEQPAQFGKPLLADFDMDPSYININNGSYGIAPRVVKQRVHQYLDEADHRPDLFHKKSYAKELLVVRGRLAKLVNCDLNDIVLVQNATTGVNTVMRSLSTTWRKGDRMLYISSTVYNACEATLRAIRDSMPSLELELLPVHVRYPLPHRELVNAVQKTIQDAQAKGQTVRLALIDAISSNPGVVVPWVELVSLFKSHNIISMIDAAHEIGQMPVNLKAAQPDFWTSNCHKWLMCQRACAVLYVAKKWQHVIHSIPTGYLYGVREFSPAGNDAWVREFEWNSTINWAPFLAIQTAIDYREQRLGGEERINAYCHELAVNGGELVAEMLGTETMRNKNPADGELVANMVNVRLPISVPMTGHKVDQPRVSKILAFLMTTQLNECNTIAPCFLHGEQLWTRLSAHATLELEDFKTVGHVLQQLCDRVQAGQHEQ